MYFSMSFGSTGFGRGFAGGLSIFSPGSTSSAFARKSSHSFRLKTFSGCPAFLLAISSTFAPELSHRRNSSNRSSSSAFGTTRETFV